MPRVTFDYRRRGLSVRATAGCRLHRVGFGCRARLVHCPWGWYTPARSAVPRGVFGGARIIGAVRHLFATLLPSNRPPIRGSPRATFYHHHRRRRRQHTTGPCRIYTDTWVARAQFPKQPPPPPLMLFCDLST